MSKTIYVCSKCRKPGAVIRVEYLGQPIIFTDEEECSQCAIREENRKAAMVNDIIESLLEEPHLWRIKYFMGDPEWLEKAPGLPYIYLSSLDIFSVTGRYSFMDRMRLRWAVYKWKKTKQEKK